MSTQTHYGVHAHGEPDEIDLSMVAAVVRENALLIALVTVAVLLLGVTYAFVAAPKYRADAIVQVDDSTSLLNEKLGDLAALFDSKGTAEAEIELIRSRQVVDYAVRTLHLEIDARPHYFPLIGAWLARGATPGQPGTPMWGFGRFAWGGEVLRVKQFDVPPVLYDTPFTLRVGAGRSFTLIDPNGTVVAIGETGESVDGKTRYGPLRVYVEAFVAREGTEFTLARASRQLTTEALQDALDVKEKARQSGVISIVLEGNDSEQTAQTVNTIAQRYVQRNVDLKSAQAQQMLDFLDLQLPRLRAELDRAEQRYNAFRNRHGTVDLAEETRLLLRSIVDGKARMIALQQQRDELVPRFAAGHPSLAALDAQLASLRREQDRLEQQVKALPDMQQVALGLQRDVEVNTVLYTKLMDSAQQLRVLRAGQQGSARIVDYAVTAEQPVKPRKALVIGVAALLGLALGVSAAFVRRSLTGGLEHTIDIEHAAGVPVYASISHSARQAKLQRMQRSGRNVLAVLAVSAPQDVAVEGIRSLRTALQFRMGGDAINNVVMVTGPRPGVGKSFLSVNLAAVLAAAGKRVLLIDADLRRGSIESYVGVAREPGLADLLTGATAQRAVQPQVLPGLDVLSRGTSTATPAELLMDERFTLAIKQFSGAYDVVIVDTPPVLAVTDSMLIGKHAGTTLLAMRHGRHSAAELRHAMRLLGSAGVAVSGIVLCDVPQRATAYGGFSPYESVAP
ncbi:polysaccharide biosynthesis tyrosine autokinase [Paraburkholderia rhizosphaerae]|uniref:Putative tyrosine-protein kinase EpsB n=1 Tax=Paraburkholderia rhizosphaerae TaxID=480658 RepID=A0A4R8LNX5_9BURK|nr:polysaccharide biosynthesis tyrosine autokinase [Paraburkholderia rhizosphaerae]TDY45350.1 tyrosine-protein kinase Etk/Wzc [Paraburkholderia rhizosphaerae]